MGNINIFNLQREKLLQVFFHLLILREWSFAYTPSSDKFISNSLSKLLFFDDTRNLYASATQKNNDSPGLRFHRCKESKPRRREVHVGEAAGRIPTYLSRPIYLGLSIYADIQRLAEIIKSRNTRSRWRKRAWLLSFSLLHSISFFFLLSFL